MPTPFPFRGEEAYHTLGHMPQCGCGVRLFWVKYPFNYTQVPSYVYAKLRSDSNAVPLT